MSILHSCISGAALVALVSSAANAQVEGRALEQTLGGSTGAELASFAMYDALERDGIGRSDAASSGGLGWGESSFLRNYMLCYRATGDLYWLDKLIDHFDRMVANMTDPDGDGFLAWLDVDYSVGLADVVADGDVGAMSAELSGERIYVNRGGELITGDEYRIEVSEDGLAIRDVTAGEDVAVTAYTDPTVVESIPGLKVTVPTDITGVIPQDGLGGFHGEFTLIAPA